MGRSQETFSKKEKEKKRLKKRQEKAVKREERKANSSGGGLDNMMAYVDEFGNITDTPPDPTKKKEEIDAESIELGVPKREEEEFDPIRKGKVEFFNHNKGFGFIRDLDTQDQYFVHINDLKEPIDENDKVSFEIEQGLKGPKAVRVDLIK
ncbi:MAG: cold-shock protein [Salibacteraceae bacterium]